MRQTEDPASLLNAWPELEADPKAMDRLAECMAHHMQRLKEQENESAQATHFQLLCWVWALLAIGIYLLWPLLASFLAAHPILLTALIGFGAVSLLAPLLLIPVLRSSHGTKKFNTVH